MRQKTAPNVFSTIDFGLIFVSQVCENLLLMLAGDRLRIEHLATSPSTMTSWDIELIRLFRFSSRQSPKFIRR